jgi:hypothetical protein
MIKNHVTSQTMAIERELLPLVKKQLGRNFIALVCGGSRAYGDDLPDSDYDGLCYVHDPSRARLDLSRLQKTIPAVHLGICLKDIRELRECAADPENCPSRFYRASLVAGRGRLVGGENVLKILPSARRLLAGDWRPSFRLDYKVAIKPGHPANVYRREPRRHAGFIIAICDQLLIATGTTVACKADLPGAMRQHHPHFRVVGILRRALRRRAHWDKVGSDKREIAAIRRDLDKFLDALRRYVS